MCAVSSSCIAHCCCTADVLLAAAVLHTAVVQLMSEFVVWFSEY